MPVALRTLADGPLLYELSGRGGHLAALIVDEIRAANEIQIALPMPQTASLRKLARDMVQKPALDLDLNDWAEQVGVNRSTFTRRFRGETGPSFGMAAAAHAAHADPAGQRRRLRQAAVTAGYRKYQCAT